MTITAKFAGRCGTCGQTIVPGTKIEWTKGSPVRHTSCAAPVAAPRAAARPASLVSVRHTSCAAPVAAAPRRASRNWDPDAFAGYGRPRGAYRRACRTDGNCSSMGSGRSCGGHDCDGY